MQQVLVLLRQLLAASLGHDAVQASQVKLTICDGVVKEQLLSAEAARVAQCTQLRDHCVEPGLLSLDQGRAGMLPVLSHPAQVFCLLRPLSGHPQAYCKGFCRACSF